MADQSAPNPGRRLPVADEADHAVMVRMAAGDPTSIEVLYDRYKSNAYGLALRITGDGRLAEDAVQEAFVGAWRNAGRYDEAQGSVKTWLLAIVHNRAIDATRRRRPTVELPDAEFSAPAVLVAPDVWAEVAGRLDRVAIQSAMATLSPVQREAIELAYFGGLTQQEIATRTAVPLGTVKGRMRLGLIALRRAMSGDQAG